MKFIDRLTPKDTEEVKPGLFIQTREGSGGKAKYRRVEPLVWNGKVRWKAQLKTVFCWRTLFSLGLVLLLVGAYLHDTRELREFYFDIKKNPFKWCANILENAPQEPVCTEIWAKAGLCNLDDKLNYDLIANGSLDILLEGKIIE